MGSLLIGLLIGFFLGTASAIHRYFVCPYDECDFHAYVRLEGWEAPDA